MARQGWRGARLWPALALVLSGCGGVERLYNSQLTDATPVDWWHQFEGGTIAQQRPPPPGLGQPYPNLDQVPTTPVVVTPLARRALTTRLAAERDRTRRDMVQDPLTTPAKAPPASPPTAAPDPNASKVVADAASAPAAPPPPPAPRLAPALSRPPPPGVAIAFPRGSDA